MLQPRSCGKSHCYLVDAEFFQQLGLGEFHQTAFREQLGTQGWTGKRHVGMLES